MEPHEPYNRGQLKEGSDWDRYLSEIEIVDRWVGKLWRTVKRYQRRRGYIILSADHGEAFGEHGTKFHTKTLYQEMVRVPLIVWGPGVARRKLDAQVSLIDVGPTVLEAFRVPVPDTYMGRSMWPLIRGYAEALPRPIFLEGRLRQAMYTPDGLKVIEDTVRRITEVYDLKTDPGELRNIFDLEPARAHPAVAEMRAFFQQKTLIAEGYDPPFKP
jgi:arylsulfatase A-like enzyme